MPITNQELKQKWIDALRSGQYEQAKGFLNMPGDGYCCLGVLCDISKRGIWVDNPYDGSKHYQTESEGDGGYPPKEVFEELGIEDRSEQIEIGYRFSELNDSRNYSFEEIARVVEEL